MLSEFSISSRVILDFISVILIERRCRYANERELEMVQISFTEAEQALEGVVRSTDLKKFFPGFETCSWEGSKVEVRGTNLTEGLQNLHAAMPSFMASEGFPSRLY